MNGNNRIPSNNNAANIYELQQYLRYISQNTSWVPLVNPDGIYGIETANAVKTIQRRFGLPATGETNFETWNIILGFYDELYRKNRLPSPIYVYPLNIPFLEEGDAFDEIYILQVMLNRLGKAYTNIEKVDITGEFDRKTTNAVNSFKTCCTNMESDGRVDREAWNLIAETYSNFTFND